MGFRFCSKIYSKLCRVSLQILSGGKFSATHRGKGIYIWFIWPTVVEYSKRKSLAHNAKKNAEVKLGTERYVLEELEKTRKKNRVTYGQSRT